MTAGEIAAAQSATTSIFQMFTTLVDGNMEIIFIVAGVVAVVCVITFLIRSLLHVVGVKSI